MYVYAMTGNDIEDKGLYRKRPKTTDAPDRGKSCPSDKDRTLDRASGTLSNKTLTERILDFLDKRDKPPDDTCG